MKNVILLALAVVVFWGFGCDDDPSGPDDIDYSTVIDISFSEHVQVILNEYQQILTNAGIFPEGLQLDSWENLIRGWRHGEVIIPFDADISLLIELTTKLDNLDELRIDKLNLLIRWINEGAQNDNGEVPYANSNNRLYVCNQGAARISVIDTKALVVMRSINLLDLNLGFSLASNPHHIAVEPNGEFWYLSLTGESKILKFNKNNEFVGQADTPIPALLAAHPTNGLLYVSRFPQVPGMPPPNLIGVIERSTMNTLADIPVRPVPHAMAVDNAGGFVYTCSLSESEVVPINPTTNEADEASVNLGSGKGPLQLAISPDDKTLYVSNQISNEMIVVNVSDPANRTIVATVPVNKQPWHPVFTPDGGRVYVGNSGDNTVTALTTTTHAVLTVIGVGDGTDGLSQPHGIAVSDDGQYVFVSGRNLNGAYQPHYDFGDNATVGTVVVINTATNSIEKVIEVEEFGSGMAIWEQ